MDDRVKYYEHDDTYSGYNLSKIEKLPIPKFEEIDINDAIEYSQISLYFNAGTRLKTWSDEDYEKYKSKSETLLSLTKRFFNQINDQNIIKYYNSIELGYHSDFWVLFDNCKLFVRISNEVFEMLISECKLSPNNLFLHNNIVRRYGNELKRFILRNECGIQILLHVYEDYTKDEKLFLPDELTKDDIANYIDSYIDGERPNTKYLRDISNMKRTSRFAITDEIRLKAKRRYEIECAKIIQAGYSTYFGYRISFSPDQDEEKMETQSGQENTLSYSKKWLSETLDFPSILNNFIYLFDFVDVPQMRCNHVNRMSQAGVFERILVSKSPREYPINTAFAFSNGVASIQMHAYYEFLASQNIRLEDAIKWVFTEYLQSEFGCAEIRLSMPSSGSTYAEKCPIIIIALESILRQYSLYVENGEIDFDLIAMSTTPIRFADIKSLVEDKYIYGVGADYKQLSMWLFSAHMLSLVDRIHKDDVCFVDLLSKETVYISDYREDERRKIEKMMRYDLISIDSDGRIALKDAIMLVVLRDLYHNDVVSRWHYPPKAQKAISDFIKKGVIVAKSTLLSHPEIDYLNYLLNRVEYTNGLEIRNRYMHGIMQVNTNEDEHKKNYFLLLRLFVLIAIKVNDDFCLLERRKEQNARILRDGGCNVRNDG